ncbi:hypothetical protein QN277_010791 [Acacia crassicarpa]|uniref:Uncharacterized protein n=1 Tax=Acacia crassicarpa TaxID=499986 RepID=A0AAE1ILY0_9FABA|nr:hypothetical protein QN277_010791 [Acacia crassicarpa]
MDISDSEHKLLVRGIVESCLLTIMVGFRLLTKCSTRDKRGGGETKQGGYGGLRVHNLPAVKKEECGG